MLSFDPRDASNGETEMIPISSMTQNMEAGGQNELTMVTQADKLHIVNPSIPAPESEPPASVTIIFVCHTLVIAMA